ncbi:follicle cell protein 3C-1 [Anoplophora glabripennis]|uniref:follicle cell protein 3C-1 n=1 Tax=Anoplophora glabripennis TaxID=217634 RepID=UPI0008747E95|nr:follicle cell protein 3C-1 [Anoplophora glabripennis]
MKKIHLLVTFTLIEICRAGSFTTTQTNEIKIEEAKDPVPCTCGVFLSGQFKKGSKDQPKGVPVLTQEMDTPFFNNAVGNRQCVNKCLELIIRHLPRSKDILCSLVDRENVHREKAYLFIKNHSDKWHGTNLSAGREFCCRNNEPYRCYGS